jgi:hypothetical protein
MKTFILTLALTISSFSSFAEGEKASRNIDCCHTGLCKTDIPLCSGVSRNPERREVNQKLTNRGRRSSKASSM